MTRQEAIGILKYTAIGGDSRVPEAIKVAIEVLSKEQVRCEQCIHWNDKIPVAEDTGECRMLDSYTLADWFCADGERRTDADHD